MSRVTKRAAFAPNLVFLPCSMNKFVTRLTQGDEVIRAIPTRLS